MQRERFDLTKIFTLMDRKRIGGSMKVRKFFSLIFFMLFLLFPLHLQGKKFFVKLAFGLASGGNVEDTLLTQSEYSHYISMGEEKRSSLGQDLYLEFIYQITPHISLSVGNGYTSKMLKGKTAQFTSPESSHIEGGFTLSPEFASEAIPICFSVIFSYPASPSLWINFAGGVGYYFGTFESKSEWQAPSLPGFSTWEFRSWNFKGKANTIGYHVGAGFDIDLSWNLFLAVDALYRIVNFNNIKSSGDVGGDTTFFYLRFFEGDEVSMDIDYRIPQVSLSGFSVRAGFKFKF